jgi:hypothetical protein
VTEAKAESTAQTMRQRSERTGRPEFRRSLRSLAHGASLGAPQSLGSGAKRARPLPNYAPRRPPRSAVA